MNQRTRTTIASAERAVTRLLAATPKGGPLHTAHPKAVAQVNRTGKWLLTALAALQQCLTSTSPELANDAAAPLR